MLEEVTALRDKIKKEMRNDYPQYMFFGETVSKDNTGYELSFLAYNDQYKAEYDVISDRCVSALRKIVGVENKYAYPHIYVHNDYDGHSTLVIIKLGDYYNFGRTCILGEEHV